MTPVIRRFFHGLIVSVCVLLAGIEIALWNRSYSRGDVMHFVSWQEQDGQTAVHLSGFDMGVGCIQYVTEWSVLSDDSSAIEAMQGAAGQFQRGGRPYRSTRPNRNLIRDNGESLAAALGFEYREFTPEELRASRVEVVIPFWFLLALTLTYPIAAYILRVLRRSDVDRKTQALCPRCGEPLPAGTTHCTLCDRPVFLAAES